MTNLIVVESEGKSKLFASFLRKTGLGDDWSVISCNGHYAGMSPKSMGINTKNKFSPSWKPLDRKYLKIVKAAVTSATAVYAATDLSPNGEAIAHQIYLTSSRLDTPFFRLRLPIVSEESFHTSISNPGAIDTNLLNSFLAREAVDRFVRFRLASSLSSSLGYGVLERIPSLLLTELARRERKVRKHVVSAHWVVRALLGNGSVATSAPLSTEAEADAIVKRFKILEPAYTHAQTKELPPPPFITSSLISFMSDRYGFLPSMVMKMCETLYGLGYITQPYTDSFLVPDDFIASVRSYIQSTFGTDYLHPIPRRYIAPSDSRGLDAIRPANISVSPSKSNVRGDLRTLYSAIWFSAIASQGSDVIIENQRCDYSFPADPSTVVSATGVRLASPGWHQLSSNIFLPTHQVLSESGLSVIEASSAIEKDAPPRRHTASSLVSWLDAKSVGRSYNYSSSISSLLDSGYVKVNGGRLKITDGGEAVLTFLRKAVPDLIDPDFHAEIEEEIDSVACGTLSYEDFAKDYWTWTASSSKSMDKMFLRTKFVSPGGKKTRVRVHGSCAWAYSPSDKWESRITFDPSGRFIQVTSDD